MRLPIVTVATIHKFGSNLDVDSAADEDMIPQGGLYVFPSSTFVPTIVSTDTEDDGAPVGDGARTVLVEGLDANWHEQSETVTMNGTTPVVLVGTYIRINRATVVTVGVDGSNAGVIDVLQAANVVARIPILFGQTQQLVFSIPANWTEVQFHGLAMDARVATTALVNIDTRYRNFGEGWRVLGKQFLTGTDLGFRHDQILPDDLEPKGDLVIRVGTSVNDTTFVGHMYLTGRRNPTA